MTDGPFRNANLSSRWKRYGDTLVSDAINAEERAVHACHSMLGDMDVVALSSLLNDLNAYVQRPQMDLDPISGVEAIFDSNLKTPMTDILQKHMAANLREHVPGESALDQALGSAVKIWTDTTKSRLDDECRLARDLGDMNREDFRKGIERNRETFATINQKKLCDALISGDKRAFKNELQKKTGVDEGPDE